MDVEAELDGLIRRGEELQRVIASYLPKAGNVRAAARSLDLESVRKLGDGTALHGWTQVCDALVSWHEYAAAVLDRACAESSVTAVLSFRRQQIQANRHAFLMALATLDSMGESMRALRSFRSRVHLYLPMSRQEGGRPSLCVFLGHGRSHVWKDLERFLREKLRLSTKEYRDDPTPGFSRKERLQQLLDECGIAFLIMTAEDRMANDEVRARANVIHEIGLFQGRYGFNRAIVCLEEGCAEFSNIEGIDQIRFPPGNIEAKFEEVRDVLIREGYLNS